jgi:protein TonB
MVSGSHSRRFAAAGATLALHALAVGLVIRMIGTPLAHRHTPPVEVALLTPPTPEPVLPRTPVARTEPRPLPRAAKPDPAPASPPAPAPTQPVVAASPRPVEESRPAAITAAAAPADAPVAPRVTEAAPPPPVVREAPTAPQRTGPRMDASWSGNTPPPYPAMARRMGEEGEVRLDVQVGADGQVLEVRLKKSSGSRLLDQTAIETVKKWRFSPATIDGRPVAEWYRDWKWVFKLES